MTEKSRKYFIDPYTNRRNTSTMTKTKTSIIIFILVLTVASPAVSLCIKNERANLRKGPGTNYEKRWEVFKYMPFKLLRTKNNWKQVQDLDGDEYWVHAPLTTQKYKCAVIKNDQTNLREGPGTKFPKVSWAPMDKFFSMKVLKVKDNWVQIEDAAGDKAWIYRPLIWIQ
jgi:SH3-like domain-containing protein